LSEKQKKFFIPIITTKRKSKMSADPLVQRALEFATEKHKDQKRKNKSRDAYIVHPVEVMNILKDCGVTDTATLCAALLHDTVEDTGTTSEELVENFGQDVCTIVLECTDDKSLAKVDRKKAQIEHAKHISDKGKLVKLADKLSNIGSLTNDPPARWSEEVVTGYVRWGFAVCEGLFGVNDKLDEKMKAVFQQFGVTSVTQEQLEYYYSII
jgi:(p)ppGpp synthase/HD superfamily hydrolase